MNGVFYDLATGLAEKFLLARLRRTIISPLRGTVVDVGCGTGANFPYFSRGVHVIALEPDASMAQRARRRLARAQANIELHVADDAFLDTLPSAGVDAIVTTLVLCTVEDPQTTLRRAKRVLKPDGSLAVLEHVRSPGRFGAVQDFIAPAWQRIADGCHLNRDTQSVLAAAGFDVSRLRTKTLPILVPIPELLHGRAVAGALARVPGL